MTPTPQRLDALMDKHRLDLGLRWREMAEAAGVTQQTLLQVRKGEPVADLTIARVERALGWAPGSIQSVREGGDPIPLAPNDAAPVPASAWDEEIIGPSGAVEEGEILRWRDEGDTRTYELTVSGVSFEGALGTDVGPEEALPKLRRMMALRVSQANALLAERLHALG